MLEVPEWQFGIRLRRRRLEARRRARSHELWCSECSRRSARGSQEGRTGPHRIPGQSS